MKTIFKNKQSPLLSWRMQNDRGCKEPFEIIYFCAQRRVSKCRLPKVMLS